MNINLNPEIVKRFSPENLKTIKDYLLIHPKLADFVEKKHIDDRGTQIYDFLKTPQGPKCNCPLSIPQEFTQVRHQVTRKGIKRKSPAEKYTHAYKSAMDGFLSDSLIMETYEKRLKERALIFYNNPEGGSSVFYGTVKGSDYYNKILTDRINSVSEVLANSYKHFYFLTFTYAYNQYGTNLIYSWKLFNKQLASTFRALRKKYKMGYVCVLEATKKGYPHAHVILAVDEAIEPEHEELKDGEQIKEGILYDFVKSHVASPVFSLQKAGRVGLVKYLGKYISKSSEGILTKGLNKKGQLPKADRKALLSCLMPVLAEVRQYRFSIRDNREPLNISNPAEKNSYAALQYYTRLKWASPEGDETLIPLLNKLTGICQSKAWIMTEFGNKEQFTEYIGYYQTVPLEILEAFDKHGTPIGCAGCIITDLLRNLKVKDSERINLTGKEFAEHLKRYKTIRFKKVYENKAISGRYRLERA